VRGLLGIDRQSAGADHSASDGGDGPAAGEIYLNTVITQYESGGGAVESFVIPVCAHFFKYDCPGIFVTI
jgi:hypothetical protein